MTIFHLPSSSSSSSSSSSTQPLPSSQQSNINSSFLKPFNTQHNNQKSATLCKDGKCPMSRFNRKCSLLTQYLKEKGGFGLGDLSLGMTSKPFLTGGCGLVVLPRTGTGNGTGTGAGQINSMDLSPQVSEKEEILKPIVADNTRAPTAQMSIFYSGQVVVFDDFPADKAKEVMLLAGRSISEFCPATSVSGVTAEFPSEVAVRSRDEPGLVILPVPRTPEPVTCDLPLARRKSLHRFLEKRKDRITTRAPYPQINSKITSPGSPLSKAEPLESNKSWLSLSAPSH